MPATLDIVAMYRGPRPVVRRILDQGPREDRALIFLMIACLIFFVASTPRLAREAFLSGAELNMTLGGSLMAWLFVAPLILYVLAGITHVIARALGGQGSAYDSRIALFWGLLASTPLILLDGLTAGFIGNGPERTIVGFIWFVCFLWFWISGLLTAHRKTP